jgi:hypothetical protein
MPLHEDLVLYISIWTRQQCLACGAEFQYLRRFTVPRRDTEYAATVPGIEAQYVKACKDTPESFPCPHCGYLQPDMVGTRKAVNHGTAAVAGFLIFLVAAMAAAFGLLPRAVASTSATALAGGFLLFHLLQVFANPNRDLQANLAEAKRQEDRGYLRLLKPGESIGATPALSWPVHAHLHATGFLLLAGAAFFAPAMDVIPLWLGLIAGMILFVISGSAFGNIALSLKKAARPREIVELKTIQITDGSVPEGFEAK